MTTIITPPTTDFQRFVDVNPADPSLYDCPPIIPHLEESTGWNPFQHFQVDESQKSYECAVCLDTLRNPVLHPGCSHHFCKECVETLTRCPSCRGNESFIPGAIIVRDYLAEQLLLVCNACDAKVLITEAKNHTTLTCPKVIPRYDIMAWACSKVNDSLLIKSRLHPEEVGIAFRKSSLSKQINPVGEHRLDLVRMLSNCNRVWVLQHVWDDKDRTISSIVYASSHFGGGCYPLSLPLQWLSRHEFVHLGTPAHDPLRNVQLTQRYFGKLMKSDKNVVGLQAYRLKRRRIAQLIKQQFRLETLEEENDALRIQLSAANAKNSESEPKKRKVGV